MAKKTSAPAAPEPVDRDAEIEEVDRQVLVDAELLETLERWDVDGPLPLARAVELLLTSPSAADRLEQARRARWYLDQYVARLEAAE